MTELAGSYADNHYGEAPCGGAKKFGGSIPKSGEFSEFETPSNLEQAINIHE